MTTWKIAGAQMDCQLGAKDRNLQTIRSRLAEAAGRGARLIVFPECALTGYAFESKAEALVQAEPIPGPATTALANDCRVLGVWTIFGLVERDEASDRIFNACVLIGPQGLIAGYRTIHLPFLGLDRFASPGDRPFAV